MIYTRNIEQSLLQRLQVFPTFIIVPHEVDYPIEANVRVCDLENVWKYLSF